ncbi:MAG: hypothetical protein KIT73_17545 [Burkholderiales bacterium]|nr:hypothetical protein [Burkholderiales bacterium]
MSAATPGAAIGQAIANSLWIYPTANVLHIVGIVLVVGPVLVFDLRLLGLGRAGSVRDLGQALLPWSLMGLAIAVPAGLVLFAADADAVMGNPAFRLKLLLLTVAGANAVLFHAGGAYRLAVERDPAVPLRPRLHALISAGSWVGIITAGRLIAYV